jgi:biopolymer transport protein ExbD
MQFPQSRPIRRPRENIVPMINVVFLLLIFFLMTAQIAPPEPFDVTLPDSASREAAEGSETLYVSGDGTLAFGAARGDAVFDSLQVLPPDTTLLIRADAKLGAPDFARLLSRLAAMGITDAVLVTGAGQ